MSASPAPAIPPTPAWIAPITPPITFGSIPMPGLPQTCPQTLAQMQARLESLTGTKVLLDPSYDGAAVFFMPRAIAAQGRDAVELFEVAASPAAAILMRARNGLPMGTPLHQRAGFFALDRRALYPQADDQGAA